jgi:hypothetical protein
MRFLHLSVPSLSLILSLFAQISWAGETYSLAGRVAGGIEEVTVDVEVGGELKLKTAEDAVKAMKMSVVAQLKYHERHLAGKLYPQRPEGPLGLRSVRFYEDAHATIKLEQGGTTPKLSAARRLVVADSSAVGPAQLLSPSGPLTREELDLLDVPANSLLLYALLPRTKQPVGGKWKPASDVLAGVLGLDAISQSDVEFVLTSAENGVATVESHGQVDGAVGGVATELEIKTKCLVDLKNGRIQKFGLAIQEKRSIGHVAPGLDVTARIRVTFAPLEVSKYLTDKALKGVPVEPNPAVLQLAFQDPSFRFYYDRRWFVFHDEPQQLMMRLVDAGDLLAQCNVNRLPRVEAGADEATPEKFQEGLKEALGDKFKEVLQSANLPHPAGLKVHQVTVSGESSGLPIRWQYFFVRDGHGRQVVFTITCEAPLADKVGDAGASMVNSFEFLKPDGQEPTPAK